MRAQTKAANGPAIGSSPTQLAAFAGGGQQAAGSAATAPADPSIAAGATDVVEAVNNALFVFSRTGAQIGSAISINTLARTPAGWAVKHPHVVYDPFSGRFILAVVQYNATRSGCTNAGSQIQVVVSGADPTAAWQAPKTFTNQAILGPGDMPVALNLALGMTSTVVAISWDYFGCLSGALVASQTDVIQRSDLAAGTLGVNSARAFTGGPLGAQPAMGLSLSTVEYQVANGVNCTGLAASSYAVFKIFGAPDSRNVTLTCVTAEPEPSGSSAPPSALQSGTSATLQTNDDRFLSAVWLNNVLWAAGNTGCTPSGDTHIRSCLNVVSVSADSNGNVSGATQLTPEGVNGAYLFYPALAVDSTGDAIATFDESSSSTTESMMVASITGGSTWSSFITLDPSVNFYSPSGCSSCTWGDYSGAVQDGLHPTDVWVVSADNDGNTGTGCANANTCWNTFIGRYTFAAPSIASLTPASGPGGGGQVVTVAGSDFATGTTLAFNGVAPTISNLTPDSFTFTTPPGPPAGGVVHAVATDALGSSSATSVGSAYLYVPLANYVPLTPIRILDTRAGSGSPLGPNSTRVLPVAGTGRVVPTGAVAVVLNVTEVDGTAGSLLTVYPAGTPQPKASNLNFAAGTVTPNLVTVTLGGGGAVNIYNNLGTVNVLADVEGYFAPPGSSVVQGEFHPIAPIRVCDTRSTSPTPACKAHGILVGGTPMVVNVTGAAVPNDGTAEAVVLNLTGVVGTAPTYISVFPTSLTGTCVVPRVSTLNLLANAVEANRVMVALGPAAQGGHPTSVCVYAAAGRINVLLDANGWYGSSTAAPGYRYQAIAPSRICDTRAASAGCATGAIGAGVPLARLVHVAGIGGVPSSGPVVQAVIANLTAVAPTAGTYLVAYPANVLKPNASDLNLVAGAILPNLVVVQLDTVAGANDGALYLYNAAGSVNGIIDIEGWFQ
ncbi:MAG TPA: IPT/TIG domain-containing protein [Candidatus Dormibacteraeota bacterium]